MQEPVLHKYSLTELYYPEGWPMPTSAIDSALLAVAPQASISHSFKGIDISQRPKEINVAFSIFFLCFLLLALAISSKGKQTWDSIRSNFFQVKARSSIFFEATSSNLAVNLLFIIQSVLLSAVFILVYFSSTLPYTPHAMKALAIIGGFSILIMVYFLLKWAGYRLMSYVFFNRDIYRRWINGWSALLSLHVFVIFVPTVLFAYVSFLYETCLYLLIAWFILSRLIILYKSCAIFFNSIDRLHYLFLYLCTQEIIPLFLLYKGCYYVFNVLENCTLWV